MTSYEDHFGHFTAMVDAEQQRKGKPAEERRTIMRQQKAGERREAQSQPSAQKPPLSHSAKTPDETREAGTSKKTPGTPEAPGFVRQVGFDASGSVSGGGDGFASVASGTTAMKDSLPGRGVAVEIPKRQETSSSALDEKSSSFENRMAEMTRSPHSPVVSPQAAVQDLQAARSTLTGWSDGLEEKAESKKSELNQNVSSRPSGQEREEPSGASKSVPEPGRQQERGQQKGKDQQKGQQKGQQQQQQKGQQKGQQQKGQQQKGQQQKGQQQQQQKGQQKGQQQKGQQQQQQKGQQKGQQARGKQAQTGQQQNQSAKPKAPGSAKGSTQRRASEETNGAVSVRPAPQHQVWGMFSHLAPPKGIQDATEGLSFAQNNLHPAIVELGAKYANGLIVGSNARAVALIGALKQLIVDFDTPEGVFLFRDLDIRPAISHLVKCRPLAVSMGVVIKHIKHYLAASKSQPTQADAKSWVLGKMDRFLEERIFIADKAIADIGAGRIVDGDVILTFGRSYVVESILKKAHARKKQFRVVVTDCGPRYEGKELLRRLVAHGVGQCSYALISSVSYVMKDATKVIVGAHTMTANGGLVSRCGTAQVAATAAYHRVPFLVACETYKFTERVQTESFSYNELGDPAGVVADLVAEEKIRDREAVAKLADAEAEGSFQRTQPGSGKKKTKDVSPTEIAEDANRRTLLDAASGPHRQGENSLLLLNLSYDLTPAQFVAAVMTEHGMIPTTAVPVVLREFALAGLE